MKPDVIVAWPRHCDYPLFRAQLARDRAHLGEIFVAFTNHHGRHDYRDFVAGELGEWAVTCFDAPEGGGDWRDLAVNACLERSSADWVWFAEQDLIVRRPVKFWAFVDAIAEQGSFSAIGWKEQGSDRWHPSCLLARREIVERTDRYFGPEPVDHFWTFGRQLPCAVYDIGGLLQFGSILDDVDVVHMAGLSHNHTLADRGAPVTYKPEAFRAYLLECLLCPVRLEPGWSSRQARYLEENG